MARESSLPETADASGAAPSPPLGTSAAASAPPAGRRPVGQRYAFVVVGVVFVALLVSSAMRSTPGVLLQPLQDAFGWSRDTVSLSAAIGILVYGLTGPFAAALTERIGVRRTVIAALVLMAGSTAASLFMTQPWHLILTWGLVSGLGTGTVAQVLGAIIANRWFATNRGLVMGLMSASTATGNLLFLPVMAPRLSIVGTGANDRPRPRRHSRESGNLRFPSAGSTVLKRISPLSRG